MVERATKELFNEIKHASEADQFMTNMPLVLFVPIRRNTSPSLFKSNTSLKAKSFGALI
ncbi:hypothetical protein RYX41_03295 [Lactiplantibacillus plantarum]|nr:hypothetical protein [Lactiplantibacillus plantarum]